MATVYSDQRANDVAVPPVPNSPNTAGRVYRKWFSVTTSASLGLIGDVIELCKIPANVRIVGGRMDFEAMGASATLSLGVSGSAAKYLAATSVAAIGQALFAATIALNFGEVLAAETTLIGTCAGANFTAAKKIYGYVEYISAGE